MKNGKKKAPNGARRRGKKDRPWEMAPTAFGLVSQPGSVQYSGQAISDDAGITVKHREFIADINGSTSAFNLVFDNSLQPGRPECFPWLNAMAQLYESYRVESFSAHYVPRCASTTAGFVAVAVDYDVKDTPPSSKTSMMSYHGAVAACPWQSAVLRSDKRDLHKLGRDFFVRSSTAASTTGDLKTYDFGRLLVAVGGQAAATQIGELYVDYVLRLKTPQLNLPAQAKADSKIIQIGANESVSKAAPLGNLSTLTNLSGLVSGGLPMKFLSGTDFSIDRAGTYLAWFLEGGTGLGAGDITLTAPAGAATISTPKNEFADATGTNYTVGYLINQFAPSAIYTLGAAGATTLATQTLRFAQYGPSSFQTPGVALREFELAHED